MGEFRLIPVKDLLPPDQPDRQESLMRNMDEFKNDIAANGLMNPICVEDMEDGTYKVFAGHRRSIAVTILDWPEVMCNVFPKGKVPIRKMKASENLKRNQLNEMEEALIYRREHEEEGRQPDEIAAYYDRPKQRVLELLDLSFGDEEVFHLLGAKQINRAQALEINRFQTAIGKKMAIEEAVKHGTTAVALRRWRLEMQRGGGEQNIEAALAQLPHLKPVEVDEPMQICMMTNHPSPLRHSKSYIICAEHWNMIIQGLEALHRLEGGQDGGTGQNRGLDRGGEGGV